MICERMIKLAAGGSAGMGITLSGDSQPYVMFGSTGMGGMGGMY